MSKHIGRQKSPILTLTVVAAADVNACRAIGLDGNYASAGGHMHGVSATNGYTGDNLAVDVAGTSLLEASAAVSADELVEITASGKFAPVDTGKAVARAVTPAGADGDVFEALLLPVNS